MFLHKTKGVGRFHRLMQTDMTERLFNHFNGPKSVLLNLEQWHLKLIRPTDQLGERVSCPCENQTLRLSLIHI